MKLFFRVLYGLVVLGGLAALLLIYVRVSKTCITKDKICIVYGHSWKKATATSPYDFMITQTKPTPALFRVAMAKTKIAGSANALAGALNQQLAKDAPSYKLVETNAVVVDKVLAVEVVFDYLPQGATQTVRQDYVVAPLGSDTYYFSAEATTTNYAKVKPQFDYLLSHLEIKQ